MIFLAVLTVGLLGSCTKSYDERLDKIDSDVLGLKEAVGQYESLSGDITSVIEALRAELGTRPASEQQSVWNCITALQNQKGTFDAAIAALNVLVGGKSVSEQIDGATAELISKYQLDGLAADIQAIKDKLTEKTGISALSEQVAQLHKKADTIVRLLSEIDDLGTMVQSVRINPASADGSVKAEFGTLSFTVTVTPAEAISGVKNLAGCLKLYSNEVKTKAGVFPEIPVTKAEIIDASKGEVSVEANVSEYLPAKKTRTLSVALNVRTGVSNYTTEFVTVKEPNYVKIAGLRWAPMNLGATTVAGSYATCAGDYYQWGSVNTLYESISWDGASATFIWKNGKPKGFNYKDMEYNANADLPDANDVVKQKIGNGWRMPTKDDFLALYEACGGVGDEYIPTSLSTATPSKGIYWVSADQSYIDDYTGVAGCLFVDGEGQKLFFPAGGLCYSYTSELARGGQYGYYWTSTLQSDDSDCANILCFGQDEICPVWGAVRSIGMPVRPVTDVK